MQRIAIDMDGVLADVYSQFLKMHADEFGQQLAPEDLIGKTESQAFPGIYKYVNSKGFFEDVMVLKDSQKYVKRLNEKYKIFVVSAALEFPGSLIEKQSWLNKHFPFITWQQMVFCGSKEIIKADIMIDDHFKNLDYFTGDTLLFTQPHNQLSSPGKHKRVNTWQEIGTLLLP
ncbi:MAG: 5'(3')-deoxyribonucleotidase [Ginsengibacter sp.]